ncbi:glycosyltransferase [Methanosarcina sp. MSH10X1]|uniref:glycosyltransferase family 2 protein n=1 Tax=Methanosarcina sp. MSH10X1 TaxID=2507075 RepID=UPI000FFB1837|nr:glycosyltransferase [Methanosarcina sp. MSH10X1]RXA21933.1 glycosyltransferase [Methanosarcina sp. MSH10X1]
MDKVQEPLVSVCCFTYNHEKYIRDAIEGFLMQKAEFPFEIIVHDDASTDMTVNIIREYEEKYPEIIKPIYQAENQYSKGIQVTISAYKKSKGKYIAVCEGDDYWTDPLKLQKQILEMEKHPGCHISFHPAIIERDGKLKRNKILGFHSNTHKIFKIEEVILGGGEFMPTNSIIINRSVIPKIISFFEIAKNAPVADYYTQILGAENGGALYLNDIMSVYRIGIPSSWTERFKKSSKSDNSQIDSLIDANNKMNEFINYKYSKQINIRNKHLVSTNLKSVNIDKNRRRSLLESHNEYISFEDKVMWHTLYKHSKIMIILKLMKDLLFRSSQI